MATRLTPPEGLSTWPAADPSLPEGPALPGGLEVDTVTELDSGWTQVRCSNGWEAWVDGRRLLVPGVAPTLPASVARRSAPPPRTMAIAGAVLAVVIIAFLLTRGGDDTRTLSADSSGASTKVTTGDATAKADLTDVDDATIQAGMAAGNAKPVAELKIAGSDEAAARHITDAMKAAGYDLGPDVRVTALGPDSNLLLWRLDESSPLQKLPSDESDKFMETFLTLPALGKAKVTRIAMDFTGHDRKGPYTLTFTSRIDDLLTSIRGSQDLDRDRIAFQVVRG